MNDKLSLYILTDTHYLGTDMWVEGESITNREMGDQIAIKSTPYILRSFFKKIIEDESTPYVLITGDLINNGDKGSQEGFINELKLLTDAGKTVFVTCATHDYAGLGDDENIFHAVRYTKDGCEEVERVYKTELPQLYFDYGHKYAHSIDNESGSYSVILEEKFRMICIYDNGNGRSHCGLFDEGFNWLTNQIKEANAEGQTVFLAVHHPVIPPWPIYKSVAEFELFGGYEKLRKIMCENNVKVIFTGHTHVHGIKKYTDSENRSFYDITTSALPSAKGKMRKVTFDRNENTCSIESIGIDRIEGFDTGGLSAEEYIYSLNFAGLVQKSLPLIKTDWEKFCDITSHVFNVPFFKSHPRISRALLSKIIKLKSGIAVSFAGKAADITKEEKKRLKDTYMLDVAIVVLKHVFSGNAPFTPDTAEYKVITSCVIKGTRLLKRFGVDIDALIPGEETALETVKHFLYNTRTGDDNSIIIDMEK